MTEYAPNRSRTGPDGMFCPVAEDVAVFRSSGSAATAMLFKPSGRAASVGAGRVGQAVAVVAAGGGRDTLQAPNPSSASTGGFEVERLSPGRNARVPAPTPKGAFNRSMPPEREALGQASKRR